MAFNPISSSILYNFLFNLAVASGHRHRITSIFIIITNTLDVLLFECSSIIVSRYFLKDGEGKGNLKSNKSISKALEYLTRLKKRSFISTQILQDDVISLVWQVLGSDPVNHMCINSIK